VSYGPVKTLQSIIEESGAERVLARERTTEHRRGREWWMCRVQ